MSAATVRAQIAKAVLECDDEPEQLGQVRLHEHQRSAAGRVSVALREYGGALVADAVGLGKTFVALAVARRFARPLVIAPAVLRATWEEASHAAGVPVPFVSCESLSRRDEQATSDFVIVDEAHHFRTPHARRYARLAKLTARVPVLLLSATPIHNRRSDLDALLALFLGSRVASLTDAELARCVIRRGHEDLPRLTLPRLRAARRVVIPGDVAVARAILSVPSPLPLRGSGDAPTLIRLSLLQMWGSSDAALLATIRRRVATGEALRDALRQGRWPSRRDLASWLVGNDIIQLGFAEILFEASMQSHGDALRVVDEHISSLREVARLMAAIPARDRHRVEQLRRIRAEHVGASVVAFSSSATTVKAIFDSLVADGGVAALTGDGGVIASGRITREELLRTFRSPAHERERVRLLLATDLLSEGVNLPEAAAVVHLDVPWTAARLEQRIGRLRRVGRGGEVASYVFTHPPPLERLIRREQLIAHKAHIAATTVGPLLLARDSDVRDQSPARASELMRRTVEPWRFRNDRSASAAPDRRCIALAAVAAPYAAFVAVVGSADERRLVSAVLSCSSERVVPCTPGQTAGLLEHADGCDATVTPSAFRNARRALAHLLRQESARRAALYEPQTSVSLTLQRRLQAAMISAPPHEAAVVAPRVSSISERLRGRLTAGLERELAQATADADADVVAACERVLQGWHGTSPQVHEELVALLLLVPNGALIEAQSDRRCRTNKSSRERCA